MAVNKLHGAEINGVARGVRRAALRARTSRDDDVRATRPYRIATIPGDGVGPEVVGGRAAASSMPRATRFGFEVDWTEILVGGAAIDAYGVAIRDEDLDGVRRGRRDPARRGRRAEVGRPDAPVRPEQALFALRGGLGLFANLRPVTRPPGARRRRRRCGPSCSRAWTCSSSAS